MALYLQANPPAPNGEVLHFAPDPAVRRVIERDLGYSSDSYTTTDLHAKDVDVVADITALPFASGRFQLLICSHVLEHVIDDRTAMSELARVTAPEGLVLIMVPRNPELVETEEDPSETDPVARLRRFGQSDHVRIYGRDLEKRLADAGFDVSVAVPGDANNSAASRRYGLMGGDEVLVCRPRTTVASLR